MSNIQVAREVAADKIDSSFWDEGSSQWQDRVVIEYMHFYPAPSVGLQQKLKSEADLIDWSLLMRQRAIKPPVCIIEYIAT